MKRLNAYVVLLSVCTGIALIPTVGLSHAGGGENDACVLCGEELDVPVVRLTEAWLDSIADARSNFNIAQIDRIDSLYRAGHFGPVGDGCSGRRAHLLARLTMINAYRDLARMACDEACVYEADEKTLTKYVERYSDVMLFGAMRIERLRMGRGHVCVRYNLDEKVSGESSHGGKILRWRVKDTKIGGRRRRVLSIDVPTGDHETVEAILARHHCFKVEYHRVNGPPAPYEWFLVCDIEGAWVRKWGTHKPSAYMFWVSAPYEAEGTTPPVMALTSSRNKAGAIFNANTYATASSPGATLAYPGAVACSVSGHRSRISWGVAPATQLPHVPLVGLRMYIRGLRFRLPSLLPDINIDDLREIELAMPILDMDYLREQRQPAWLGSDDDLTFSDWKGHGDVPPGIRARFPDR